MAFIKTGLNSPPQSLVSAVNDSPVLSDSSTSSSTNSSVDFDSSENSPRRNGQLVRRALWEESTEDRQCNGKELEKLSTEINTTSVSANWMWTVYERLLHIPTMVTGLTITNCSFDHPNVEIFYVYNGSLSRDELAHQMQQQLNSHVSADHLQLTELKSLPQITPTYGPGPGTSVYTKSSCVGAFVNIPGIGDHALSSGHDKRMGDMVLLPDGQPLGRVKVVINKTTDDGTHDRGTCDAALAELLKPIGEFKLTVTDQDNQDITLDPTDLRPENNMQVMKFDCNVGREELATVRHKEFFSGMHNSPEGGQPKYLNCMAIGIADPAGNPGSRAIHIQSESGKLVTTMPQFGRVQPIGMLIAIERLSKTDTDYDEFSIGVPIGRNLNELSRQTYCNGQNVSLITST